MVRSSDLGSRDVRARDADRSVADSAALALAIVAVLGAIYALLARFALDGFPYSGDEYSVSLQGELFARGMLNAPAPPHIEWLGLDHVVIDSWVRSKYPPGAAALLGIGYRYGAAWLVTPLEAMVTLLVVWFANRRLLGPRPALVALIALGIAPLFMFEAASFYTHMATLMFLAIAFAALGAWTRGQRDRCLVLAGMAIGCAFLTRPLDAVLFGVAMIAFRSPRAIAITAASALPFVAVNLAYQAAQFGSPFTDGYHVYEPTLRALYGSETAAASLSLAHLASAVQLWNHIDIYRALIVDWTVAGTALVALVGACELDRNHAARPMRTFSIVLIAAIALGLLVTIADPDDGARPRYLSTTLIPIAFLAAAGFAPSCAAIAARFGRRVCTIMVVVVAVFALAQLGSFLQDRTPKLWQREGLYQATTALHLTDAVVIVRAQHPARYARNGPWFDGVLYLSVSPDTTVEQVRRAFPDRQIWEAHEGLPWNLVRVQ
jgi:4-amino-4-deoxy-L-arabinose transferase-like glycosyltransferase